MSTTLVGHTCPRCGLQETATWPGTSGVSGGACYAKVSRGTGEYDWAALTCREAELSNLRALLRSVTGKLEEAAQLLGDIDAATCGEVGEPLGIINGVLEVLS